MLRLAEPSIGSEHLENLQLRTLSQSNYHSESSYKPRDDEEVTETKSSLCHTIEELKSEKEKKEKIITELVRKLEDFKSIMTGNGISGSATQKIVELSRKNRDTHSELTKEKSRVRLLQNQLSKLLAENTKQQQEEIVPTNESRSLEEELKEKIVSLEEQLVWSKRKAAEQSNLCQKLKQDLKLAQKVLTHEVGKDVTINSLSTNNGWKGRAQQILSLQNKITELQQQLSCQKKSQVITTRTQLIDDKHKASVHKMEKENKQRHQDIKVELDKMNVEYANLQQQCSALKARNKTLTLQCKEHKNQVEQGKPIQDHSQTILHSQQHICKHENIEKTIKDLRSKLSISEDERRRLKETITNYRMNSMSKQYNETGLITSSSLSDGNSFSLPVITNTKQPQTASSNRYSNNSSDRCTVSAGAMPAMSQIKFFGLDHKELSAKYRVIEIEKDRLSGLVKLHQKRLDEANDNTMKLNMELSKVRQEIRTREITGRNTRPPAKNSIELLQESLLLQEDENKILRDNLIMIRQQQQEDRRRFHSILEETSQIFSETIETIRKV